jgi:hypothetical protein
MGKFAVDKCKNICYTVFTDELKAVMGESTQDTFVSERRWPVRIFTKTCRSVPGAVNRTDIFQVGFNVMRASDAQRCVSIGKERD